MTISSSSDALASNRMGELAPSQRARLTSGLWRFGCLGLGLAFMALLFISGMAGLLIDSERDPEALIGVGFMALILGGFLLAGLWQGVSLARRLLDVNAGRVEQGEGRLTWRKSNYVPETQDRRLKLMDGLSLTPGAYRFYYLPRSGLVVNVEALGGSALSSGAGSRDEDELSRSLAEANRLRLEAYPAYRQGRLDEADQQRRLTGAAVGLGLTALIAGGIGLFLVFLFFTGAADEDGWILLAMFMFVDVLVGGLILWSLWHTIGDLREGRVQMSEGRVQRIVVRGNKSVSYYYALNNIRFSVSTAGYNALVEGRPYRIYYLPRSKTLLGIEPTAHEHFGGGWSRS